MKIAIVWLWYVWLPLAYAFDRKGFNVVGYDISSKKIEDLRNGIDTTKEVGDAIKNSSIHFTTDSQDLQAVQVIIVAVPTPINKQKTPDFAPLVSASKIVWAVLQKGQIVVYESTVYPWCTEEICIPILENVSGLKYNADFTVGYSPERINPGDKVHTVETIIKVVAGSTPETCEILANDVYGKIVKAGIHKASSLAVAEAAKIIENTQRDINIGLMNELKQICDAAGINIWEVLEAAWTKRNFLKFSPGMVGGHCIGVDPYRLAYKAQWLWLHPEIILAGRRVNDHYPLYIASQVIKKIIAQGYAPHETTLLILWLTFKPDVPDFRNSKVKELIDELQAYWVNILAHDPFLHEATPYDLHEFALTPEQLVYDLSPAAQIVLQCVDHVDYLHHPYTMYAPNAKSYLTIKNVSLS